MKRQPPIKVRDVSLSIVKDSLSQEFFAVGGCVFSGMGSMSLSSKSVSKATVNKLVALINEIYDMNLKVE